MLIKGISPLLLSIFFISCGSHRAEEYKTQNLRQCKMSLTLSNSVEFGLKNPYTKTTQIFNRITYAFNTLKQIQLSDGFSNENEYWLSLAIKGDPIFGCSVDGLIMKQYDSTAEQIRITSEARSCEKAVTQFIIEMPSCSSIHETINKTFTN